ncbi:aldo/keto reductase, partial [Staphylococcus aureus]|nr:aldo/keto reductase [Staphylococcus aureus]
DAGFTHIDMADSYRNVAGSADALIGRPRTSVFLASKVPGCGFAKLPADMHQCDAGTGASIKRQLHELRAFTGYLDLLLI